MSTLIVQSGKHKGKKVALPPKEVYIGRDEGCFIRLGSSDVSRKHCVLVPTPKGLLVRDLGSQNGTLVNDAAIEGETLLHPGDFLQVGSVVFQLAGAKPAPSAKPGDSAIDDDIAGWLSDSATEIPTSSGDTTIIHASKLTAPAPAPAPVAPAPPPKPDPSPKPQFASTAEEARDIIRRHFESLQGDK